jgi:hypothetical protein
MASPAAQQRDTPLVSLLELVIDGSDLGVLELQYWPGAARHAAWQLQQR